MADAAAKAHIGSAASDDLGSVRERVTSRACVYAIGSDFRRDGTLRPPSEREPTHRFLWDRAVFPCVRKRAARWVHTHLNEGLRGSYVDAAVIGRRWYSSDATSYAEVATRVLASAKLDHREDDPVGRMDKDVARVQVATTARAKTHIGVAGGQDAWAQTAYARERRAGVPGKATRLMSMGCAACAPRAPPADESVCDTCNGWRLRSRARRHACSGCGGSVVCAACGCHVGCPRRAAGMACGADGDAHTRKRAAPTPTQRRAAHAAHPAAPPADARATRRLRCADDEEPGRPRARWVGFAGLQQTTVERLLRAGGADAADARAGATLTPAAVLATAAHVRGGECPAVRDAVRATGAAARIVVRMRRSVGAAGGYSHGTRV